MNAETLGKIEGIYHAVMEVSPEQRHAFLTNACGDDDKIRREVESLLSFAGVASSLIDSSPIDVAAEMIARKKARKIIGTKISHYRIISQIGVGGMGEVFLAKDLNLERFVAIKFINTDLTQDIDRLHLFVNEAKTTSALNHPNIITVHEIGKTKNTPFITTEFIDGKTLRTMISEQTLTLYEMLDIASQTAAALKAAHSAGIFHRDIKPENIMRREDGLVKVLDFGLAKLSGMRIEKSKMTIQITQNNPQSAIRNPKLTSPGFLIGTAAYMSPEQIRRKKTDARSDIWSLGVVMFEMYAGKQPFKGDTASKMIASILKNKPASFDNNAPLGLIRIIDKALQKKAADRYQTVADLLTDLRVLQKHLEFESAPDLNLFRSPNKIAYSERSAQNTPNNLTESHLTIVGRENEIKEIQNLLLQPNVRIVTLTGIGGTGKTTLSKAVSKELLSEFADGVFFVDLSAITNPEFVFSTIAQSISVKEIAGNPILETLKSHLYDKQMLIVLDNFEQVLSVSPMIVDLISIAVNLKILITSRFALNIKAEREFVVSPLEVPPRELFVDYPPNTSIGTELLNELTTYEAVRLFIERAQGSKPTFFLSEENAQIVVEICLRLDGLPLAIELAAARIKILSPRAILSKLENSLQLLTGGAIDSPLRQQTMRGTIEWSYDLLKPDEKLLLSQLGVFAGGFAIEAAEFISNPCLMRLQNSR